MTDFNSPLQILQNIYNANSVIAALPYHNRIMVCFPDIFGINIVSFGKIKFGNSSETKPLTIDLIGQIAHTDLYCPKQDGLQIDGACIEFNFEAFSAYIKALNLAETQISPTFRDWWTGEKFNSYIKKFDMASPHDFFLNGIKIPAQMNIWTKKVQSMFPCLK